MLVYFGLMSPWPCGSTPAITLSCLQLHLSYFYPTLRAFCRLSSATHYYMSQQTMNASVWGRKRWQVHTGHLNFFSEGVSSWPAVELATLYLLWDGMSSGAGRASDDVGGPHIWEYGLQRGSLREYYTDRRSVGSDLQSFGITWLISRLTVVIISL